MTEQQTQQKRDGHLTVYLAWPILAGLGLATVLAVSIGGVSLIVSRDWQASSTIAGVVWFVALGLVTVFVFLYAMQEWAGPRQAERQERLRQEVIEIIPDDLERPPAMVLRPLSRRPMLPAPSFDHTIETITPAVDPEIDHLYRFVIDAWQHNDVTQSGCMARGWRRKDWDKFIGGSRRRADLGKESRRGLLDRAGIVVKDGNKWTTCATLEQALSINDELHRYASEKSKMVVLGKTDQSRQVTAAGVDRATGLD
jgi:hypothetical protein